MIYLLKIFKMKKQGVGCGQLIFLTLIVLAIFGVMNWETVGTIFLITFLIHIAIGLIVKNI